jgi:hypothetical protein
MVAASFYGIPFSSPPNLLMSISDNWEKIKVAHSPAHCCHYPPEKKGRKETGPIGIGLELQATTPTPGSGSSYPHFLLSARPGPAGELDRHTDSTFAT